MTPEKLCQDLGTYYDKPLTTTQAIPIIKHIDHYPVEKLRELFNLIVNNCEFLPKLSRIVDLSEQLGSINKVGCPKCDWTGFVEGKTKVIGRNRMNTDGRFRNSPRILPPNRRHVRVPPRKVTESQEL